MGSHYCRARGRLYDWCSVSAACALTGQVRSLLLRCWRTNQQAGLKHLRVRRGQGEGRQSRRVARGLSRRGQAGIRSLFNQEANQHKPSNKTMPKRSRIPATSGNLARLSGVVSMWIDTHIRSMPRSASSPATPDLFSYMPSPPVPSARRTLANAKSPVAELGSSSDARLARLLREITSIATRSHPIRRSAATSWRRISEATRSPSKGRAGMVMKGSAS